METGTAGCPPFSNLASPLQKTKINNANGTKNDVNKELNAFLDYIAGKESEDSFVQKLKEAVKKSKKKSKLEVRIYDIIDISYERIRYIK